MANRLALSILLIAAATVVSFVSYYESWVTNLLQFTTLIISGIVVIMLGGAGALLYDYIKSREPKKKVEVDIAAVNPKKYSEQQLNYDREQLVFRSELRQEMIKLREELNNVQNPNEVPFRVWNRHKPEEKQKLVGNQLEYVMIQDFYTAMQDRYDYQKNMNHPDARFTQLNRQCLVSFNDAIGKVKWPDEPRLMKVGRCVHCGNVWIERTANILYAIPIDRWDIGQPIDSGTCPKCNKEAQFFLERRND